VRLVPVGRPDVPVVEILFGSQVGLRQCGGPNGIPGSRLTSTTGPLNPSSRKVAAAVPPALPPPTITIGLVPGPSDMRASSPSNFVARPHFAPRRGAAGRLGELGLVQGGCTL